MCNFIAEAVYDEQPLPENTLNPLPENTLNPLPVKESIVVLNELNNLNEITELRKKHTKQITIGA